MVKVFCEGSDDKKFLEVFIKHHNVENIEIISMGGKSKLLDSNSIEYKKTTKQIGKKIKKVVFVFDCDFEKDDNNCGGCEKSKICFDELKNKLSWDCEIELFLFDRNLDYFLMETIKNKECFEYFDSLINCLGLENIKKNKKPIANLYRSLYPYPQFDFNHKMFEKLKKKLKYL